MKKLFFLVAIIATAVVQTGFAQQDHATVKAEVLLPAYFDLKDALVASDANLTATSAGAFVKAINSTNDKMVDKASRASLLEYAGKIAASKDLKSQREYFVALSDLMIRISKNSKLSADPVYLQYCPMKKANWLSSEKNIKNPYYGGSMLTCGKVVETIK